MPLISLLFLAALAAEPVAAAGAPVSQPPAAAPAKPPKPKKICVEEARLGSLMTHRTCATQEAWDRRAEREALELSRALVNVPTVR